MSRPFQGAGFLPVASDATGNVWSFTLPPDSRCFEGHFDQAAVLPGVAHLALALSAHAAQTHAASRLVGLRDVRFTRPIRPGDEVAVQIAGGDDGRVRFEIRSNGEMASSGVLLLSTDSSHG